MASNTKLDQQILHDHADKVDRYELLPLQNLPRSWSDYPRVAWHCLQSFVKSCIIFYQTKPDVLFSTGGIIALPTCLAAYLMNIPIHFYELNVIPGKAIKTFAPIAQKIYCAFDQVAFKNMEHKTEYLAYPIRYDHAQMAKTAAQARQSMGLAPHKYTITVLGGSQGSQSLNHAVLQLIDDKNFPASDVQFIHQTGTNEVEKVKAAYQNSSISAYVFDYTAHLADMYVAADLVIARAGAGTIFECKAFSKQSILIPLETDITDHQKDNALQAQKLYSNLFHVMDQTTVLSHNAAPIAAYVTKLIKKKDCNDETV